MPGPRDHGALVSNQKDIESPGPPRHGGCHLFKRAWASCRRKTYCAEVRSVATATPRLLGPRFRGGNDRRARGKRSDAQRKPEKGAVGRISRRARSPSSSRLTGARDAGGVVG